MSKTKNKEVVIQYAKPAPHLKSEPKYFFINFICKKKHILWCKEKIRKKGGIIFRVTDFQTAFKL